MLNGSISALHGFFHVACFGARREVRFTHRQPEHRGDGFFLLRLKVEEGSRNHAHVGVVVNGQRRAEAAVVDQVVVPLLDAGLACLNSRAVVGFYQRSCVACLVEFAFCV
ncbi:hypothetical protein SDC9_60771 [bioreactor metagenome]|uniref:Uncharacterized protein n=1 Tax=bioreactor metagenome TaxID=1076179 RepID=A0A644XE91_9ZZZZ